MRSNASTARDAELIMDTVGENCAQEQPGWLGSHAGLAGSGQGVEVGQAGLIPVY